MITNHYKDYLSQYVTYSGDDFLYSSDDEFPVIPIAEEVTGQLADTPTRGLQLADWTTRGLDTSRTGELGD